MLGLRFNTPPPNKPYTSSPPPKQKYTCICYPLKFIVANEFHEHALKNLQFILKKLLASYIAIRLQNVKKTWSLSRNYEKQ